MEGGARERERESCVVGLVRNNGCTQKGAERCLGLIYCASDTDKADDPNLTPRNPSSEAPGTSTLAKGGRPSLKWRKKSFFVQKHCHPILPKTKREKILWDLSPCNSHPFRSSGALFFVVCRSRAGCSMHFLPTGARTLYATPQARCAHFFLVVFLRPRSSLTFKLFALY